MSSAFILHHYQQGRRDFSNTVWEDGLMLANQDLRGVNFSGCWLCDADFQNSNLTGIDFSHASLKCADLRGANLAGAVFTGALIEGVFVDEIARQTANFAGAWFCGVELQAGDFP